MVILPEIQLMGTFQWWSDRPDTAEIAESVATFAYVLQAMMSLGLVTPDDTW